jgi:hypothetical protein
VIPGQLQLDLEHAQLVALVAEPGMSEDELMAAAEDARQQLGVGPVEATPAPRCACDRPIEMPNGWIAATTCAKCGRLPRGAA